MHLEHYFEYAYVLINNIKITQDETVLIFKARKDSREDNRHAHHSHTLTTKPHNALTKEVTTRRFL